MNSFRTLISPRVVRRIILFLIIGVLLFWGLTVLHDFAFGLYHTIAELFSIIIAWAILIITLNVLRINSNKFFLFIGLSLGMIGSIDILHALSFSGVFLIPGYGGNLPTALWVVARYAQCTMFLIAPPIINRERSSLVNVLLVSYFIVILFLVVMVFAGWFPVCFIDGEGLTPFKKISEYVIIGIYGFAVWVFYYNRHKLDRHVLFLILSAIVVSMVSEYLFTLYSTPQDYIQVGGHFLKICAFFLIYQAFIAKSLHQPFETFFRAVKEQETRYRALFNNMSEGFALHEIICDERGHPINYRFLDLNQAFERLTGLKKDAIMGKTVLEAIPNLELSWIEVYGKVALTGEPAHFTNHSQPLGKDYDVIAYRPAENQFATVFRDISEETRSGNLLHDKTVELERSNHDLERSNRELETFAYAASHDLQEPLRTITSFVQLLGQRCQGQLDEDAKKYLGLITESAGRMGRMISDLLEYSRIQSRGAPCSKVDLNQVLRDVLSNLAVALKESSTKVTTATLPYVTGDAIQLVQLFQNLIQNAIKYRQENRSPIIHVGLIPQPNGMVHLFIRDNGIGIDPKFFEKLFVLFHRLHPRDKYPGTGVGLASCKKIVERHGGQIWVESEVGKGSTFHFTLPRSDD